MSWKMYIATGLPRLAEQQALAAALAVDGVELTFDWTRHGTLSGRPRDEVAVDEIKGIKDADLLIVLLPGGRGTHAELGAALMNGTTVFIHAADPSVLLGTDGYTCVFYDHPLAYTVFGTMDDLLVEVRAWMNEDHYG